MKNRYLSYFLLSAFFFFTAVSAQAQKLASKKKSQPFSYWETNLNVGPSLFFGDVKQNPVWPVSTNNNEWRLGGSLMAGYRFNYIFGLRGQALYGQIAGTRRSADYFFEGDYLEFNINTTIDLNNLFGKKRTDRFASAYLLFGLGLTNYNSTVYRLSTGSELRKIGFGNGSGISGRTLEGIALGGVGVNFRINDHFLVNLESANRIMNSDNMDGWVKGFKYDIYNYTSVGLTYRFGMKKAKTAAAPPTPVVTHQNVKEVPPVQPKPEPKKKPCTVEVQPIAPPAQTKQPEKQPQQAVVPVQNPVQKPAQEKQPETHITATARPAKPLLEYRVQIRAKYGVPVSMAWLSRKYGLPQNEIREDKHNGYYIYTVGSYATYEQARKRRDQLRSRYGIIDAFVVAFKNGYRLDKLP
jgi:hypothetical protein